MPLVSKNPPFILSTRFLLAILGFLGYTIHYAQKMEMSVAIVCMVNHTAISFGSKANHTQISKCHTQAKAHQEDGEFNWNKLVQGFVLSSFFYGYALSQIPAGWFSLRFGGKIVYLVGMSVASAISFVTPVLTHVHFGLLIVCRVITGFALGLSWPCMYSMWSSWAPAKERGKLIGISNSGTQVGSIIMLPLGGYLCVNGFGGGWPSIFYVTGILGIIWCVLWLVCASNTPEQHKFISQGELNYLKEELKDTQKHDYKQHHSTNVPWKKIFKSKAVWALIVGHTTSNCGVYLFLTNIPTYMNEILEFDIHSNGALSCIPYICFWIAIVISGLLSDLLIRTKKLSLLSTRRLFNILGFVVPIGALVGLGYVSCKIPYVAVALLSIALAFIGCTYSAGYFVNYSDISGEYSGIVFSIGNTFASIPGIVVPYIVSGLTKNHLQSEWRLVFFIVAGIYAFGIIFLTIFTETVVQPWALSNKLPIEDKTKLNEISTQEKE